MNIVLGFIGLFVNFLFLIIPLFILLIMHRFSFLSYFLLCLIFNAINEAIKMQTKAGVIYHVPYASQRSIIEHNIVNGTVTINQRILYFVLTFVAILFGGWEFTISIAIYAGIVTLVYNLVH